MNGDDSPHIANDLSSKFNVNAARHTALWGNVKEAKSGTNLKTSFRYVEVEVCR
jgi:hypothetical protein